MSNDESADEWLFDFILLFLKSPVFTVPLVDFIDANCLVFDGDDENKLCYTDIHNQFRELLDQLISSNLAQLGVTSEQFVLACARGKDQDVNKAVFEQILAVDDFMTFKKMMVKRNMALEVEALENLQRQQSSIEECAPASETDEQAQLEAALKLSALENQRSQIQLSARQLVQQLSEKSNEPSEPLDADIEAALAASLIDAELQAARDRRDLADMEAAIALSVQIEQQRLERKMELQIEQALKEEQAKLDAAAAAEATAKAEAAAAVAIESSVIAKQSIQAVDAVEQKYDVPPAPTPEPAKVAPAPVAAASSLSLLGNLPAIKPVKASLPVEKLIQFSETLEAETEALAKRAAQEFESNAIAVKQNQPKLSDEERARRQEFLRAQRDKLLAQKRAQRHEEEAFMNAERARLQSEREALSEAMQRNAAAALDSAVSKLQAQPAQQKASEPAPPPKQDDNASRMSMRQALAQRFKNDMLQKQAVSSTVLDDQLAKAEKLRAEAAAERAHADQIAAAEREERAKAAEIERKKRLDAMHAAMQMSKIDAAQADFL